MKRCLAAILSLFFLFGAAAPTSTARFSASGIDDAMDLHGDPAQADLVLFVGGNQWFVLPSLIAAFRAEHPEVRNIFYETLPPGVLSKQVERGSLQIGELHLHVHGDVYFSGWQSARRLERMGLVEQPEAYASNNLGIMVRAHNPLHIHSLADLGRAEVRVAMPNPATEGIARQIRQSYRLAGGAALDRRIMTTKIRAGTTKLTAIHHRQTPMWILAGTVDAGPVWLTEALYQKRINSGIEAIALPASQNTRANYVASIVTGTPHREAAQAFMKFLLSPNAQAIYRSFGFDPSIPKE